MTMLAFTNLDIIPFAETMAFIGMVEMNSENYGFTGRLALRW